MYNLIDASYGGCELIKSFFSFGEAYGYYCDFLKEEDRRYQIDKNGIILFDTRK